MRSREVRQKFLTFFKSKGHLQLPSSSLVPPTNDKTVLLTTAGMQQMTPFFLGLQTPPANRLTTVQKCFRTVDIDEVGDASHLTFFEMLGNFSVGDYFKREAIEFAWDLLTNHYMIPESKLFPTVFTTDDEAHDIWTKVIGVPSSRITRWGVDNNWWGPVGKTGPCGPDSEIYYDLGPEFDPNPDAVVGDSPRYLEIWNLVFMQFGRNHEGVDHPLARKNIDTGMGLERLSMVMQGVRSTHDTDLFQPVIQKAAEITGKPYGKDAKTDISLRVIGDHSRGATMLIADGVLPGNEDRPYILRRILRRAIRHGRLLGIEGPFLRQTSQAVMDMLGDVYPEIIERKDHIFNVLLREEETFGRTLQMGLNRFEILIEQNPISGHHKKPLNGGDVFDLFATHGFPPDLTRELAEERGLEIDWEGFEAARERHAKASTSLKRFDVNRPDMEDYKALGIQKTPFMGYQSTRLDTEVVAVFVNGKRVEAADAGQDAELVLAQTPFYVESGGQVSDTGYIDTGAGRFVVENSYKPVGDMIVHQGRVLEGSVQQGDRATAMVEDDRRLDTARNHTGTHILHQALKDVLGNSVGQAGSLVAPERLRFDFTFPNAVTGEQLVRIEQIVNQKIRDDLPVEVNEMALDEAKKSGAVMMFGEKYGDRVRVLTVGDYSKELCGGTHLHTSGQIGLMVITAESSIGSGLRRVEAVTGRNAEKYVQDRLRLLNQAASVLQAKPENLLDEVSALKQKLRDTERELANLREKQALADSSALVNKAVNVEGVKVLAAKVDVPNNDLLRSLGDKLRDTLKSGVIALGAVINDKPSLVVMVTQDLVDRGLKAGELIGPVAGVVGGRAGGRPQMAQGGGSQPDKLEEALALTVGLVRSALTK